MGVPNPILLFLIIQVSAPAWAVLRVNMAMGMCNLHVEQNVFFLTFSTRHFLRKFLLVPVG